MSDSADDRFREMFYEEARELLIGLEEGLMDLERRQSDRAHLDKTFRAAHSLKGAAAMVGLGAIAEFTHGIEAVLERIRAGSLAVDSDIITTLLEARDHLAAMVEAEAARSPIPPSGELTPSALLPCAARAFSRRSSGSWGRWTEPPGRSVCTGTGAGGADSEFAGSRAGRPAEARAQIEGPQEAGLGKPRSQDEAARSTPQDPKNGANSR